MKLKFWGVRGSIPAPASSNSTREKIRSALQQAGKRGLDLKNQQAIDKFMQVLPMEIAAEIGGNTTCITLETDDQLLIFDAGSGMRDLGLYLMGREFGHGKGRATIFFTHTHWDHIQGFPFFVPIMIPGNRFDIYHVHPHVPEVLANQMRQQVYPVDFHTLSSEITFHQLLPDEAVHFDDIHIRNIELEHPGKAYSYRVTQGGHTVVLATDGEYKQLSTSHTKRYIDFYQDADILIFDAQFSVRESIVKEDWGHSSGLIGADIARAANVKQLLLFHHDPTSTDQEILHALQQSREYVEKFDQEPRVKIDVAREGWEIDLDQKHHFLIEESQLDGVICLNLVGDFDEEASEAFTQYTLDLVQNRNEQKLILDMHDLKTLTIAGIHALLNARRNLYSLSIVNIPDSIHRVIELAETTDFFAIYDSLSDVTDLQSIDSSVNTTS
ncbi:MAG: MBL fold metallo-hydrolase [Chloroflexota bacterium]